MAKSPKRGPHPVELNIGLNQHVVHAALNLLPFPSIPCPLTIFFKACPGSTASKPELLEAVEVTTSSSPVAPICLVANLVLGHWECCIFCKTTLAARQSMCKVEIHKQWSNGSVALRARRLNWPPTCFCYLLLHVKSSPTI